MSIIIISFVSTRPTWSSSPESRCRRAPQRSSRIVRNMDSWGLLIWFISRVNRVLSRIRGPCAFFCCCWCWCCCVCGCVCGCCCCWGRVCQLLCWVWSCGRLGRGVNKDGVRLVRLAVERGARTGLAWNDFDCCCCCCCCKFASAINDASLRLAEEARNGTEAGG